MKGVLLFLSIFSFSVAVVYENGDVSILRKVLQQLLTSGKLPRFLEDVAKKDQLDLPVFKSLNSTNFSTSSTCELCSIALNFVIELRKVGIPEFLIRNVVSNACVDLKIEDTNICTGVLGPEMDVIFYIINNENDVLGEKFCSLLLGPSCNNQFDYFNWTIDIPPRPPKIPEKIASGTTKNIRILQVSDIHYDPRYTPGAKAICGEPLCCQDDQGTPDNPDEACGVWGEYRDADTSRRVLDEALRHMSTQQVDFVYFTGDIISHRVWSTSQLSNSKEEREIMDLLRNNFNVPVLFVLGNHEPYPVNTYAPLEITEESLSTKWLFDLLADELKGIISDEDLKNVQKGGFYTTVLKPGFRVIVLNNNVCDIDNLWLAYESYDPYGQLTWLVEILGQAEKNGEFVHILHHVPSGTSSCLGTWSREFTRIINRFSETISGQFNGHTHLDEFFLYFSEADPSEAINVAFNGASVATYSYNNPSYKIYDIDAQNYEIVNAEEWTFNLTAANLQPQKSVVDWYKLYSFKEAYGVSSMKPKELNALVTKMAKDKSLLQKYNKYKYRMGNGADGDCGDYCNKANLCNIVTSNPTDQQQCEKISKIYDDFNI